MSRGFLAATAIVLTAGIAVLAWETDGFRVVTSFGARQLSVEQRPRPLPDVRLRDQDGNAFSLSAYQGEGLLVEFIYTRCPTLCAVRGSEFQQMLNITAGAGFGRNINLLSISFDPGNDDREALKLYANRYGAGAPRWRIAAPAEQRDLAALLQSFEVVVIPDGLGGYLHDGSIYFVDAERRLARVFDPEALKPQLLAAVAGATAQ